MRILVPSYGRDDCATTMDLMPSAEIVVPESQKAAYEINYPGRVISIPDDQDGTVSKKRNAVIWLMGEGELAWMIDDDFVSMKHINSGKYVEDEDIEPVLFNHWVVMEELGACFGGFSISDDYVRSLEYQPFSITKCSYAALCIRNIGVMADENLGRYEDVDLFIALMNKGRIGWRDNRYYVHHLCNKDKRKKTQKGGIEGGDAAYMGDTDYMLRKWGADIVRVKKRAVIGATLPIKGV